MANKNRKTISEHVSPQAIATSIRAINYFMDKFTVHTVLSCIGKVLPNDHNFEFTSAMMVLVTANLLMFPRCKLLLLLRCRGKRDAVV